MSKSAKFMSGILAFSMALSLFVPKTFAYKVNSDVAGTVYEEAATTLGALGVMIGDDTGLFRPDDAVTRAEFSKIAVHILGLEDTAKTSQGISKFPDVATDHWANGYINVATSQKLIIGDDTGSFRPDDKISYQEAITILVRALGYEYVANTKGGYPTGFLVVGSDTGLTKKTSSIGTDPCKRGTTAQMTYNSLTINLMEPTGYTQGENITYEVTDKTLLENKLGIVKNTGVVTGNSVTKLTGTSSLNKNQVEIDSKEVFFVGSSDIDRHLGYNVTYYVKEEDNGDKTVILAQKDASRNDEITIAVDELSQEIKEDSTSIFYRIDEDSKETELELEAEKKVIYNDKYTSKLKNPATGTVKVLDTDRNGKYDVVFIDEYVNYIVDDIATASKKIYDKNGKTALDLNTETNKNLTVILENKDGEEVKFEDIKEWDVLSVFKNDNYLRAVVCGEYVEGKITEKATDSHKVVIDKTEYHVASGLDFDLLKLDLEGVFYLDMNGDIAAFNAEYKKGSNYAYLINAGLEGSLDSVLNIKFFDENGETKTLKAAEKIKIDDKTGFDAINAFNELSDNGTVKTQIFSYELNSNGEITLIDRAEDKTASFPESFEKTQFALNFKGEDLVFKKSSNKFNKVTNGSTVSSIGVNENTLILSIPTDEKDAEKMEVVTLNMLNDGSEYDIEVYDMTEDMTAKVIRITNTVSIGKLDTPVAIVEKVTTTNNSDGIKVDKLYAVMDGEKIEITTVDSTTLEKTAGVKVQSGDIIQFTENAKGELDSFTLLFDTNSKTTEFTKEYGSDGEMTVVYGKVTKKFTDSVNVSVNSGSSINYLTKDATVYKVNTAKTNNKITVTDAGEISKWEDDANEVRVFLRIYEDTVTEIVIVE